MTDTPTYRFERWELRTRDRTLVLGAAPVKLGGRAFDLLLALVERRDRVVGKDELMAAVWPRLVVEENNLQVHVAALRKLLGHPAIATVPGRGYRFTLVVQEAPREGGPTAAGAGEDDPAGLATARGAQSAPAGGQQPAVVGSRSAPAAADDDLIAREEDLALLERLLHEHALVTVCGAGGIGKTRLAQSLAARRGTDAGSPVWWVDLAPLADPSRVAVALAQALGVQTGAARSAAEAAALALRGGPALVVLDNAEHLLDAVAQLVAGLRLAAPQTRWLVTSQEPLRLHDEQQLKLGPLTLPPVPPPPAAVSPAAVAASGAGALFAARCRALDPRFVIDEGNAAAVADICRRLDGIALAIELAVARVPLLGVHGLRSRLDERFALLTAGSRAVLRKHQTLRAALAWSHDLLSAAEQRVFRRLSVFAGGFTLEAAQRVADDDAFDTWDVVEHLGALVDKALVLAEGEHEPRYRMLETTRLYAIERLAEAGETAALLERHAQALVERMAPEDDDARRSRALITGDAALIAEVDNARAALAWATTARDDGLAVRVATAAFFPMCAAQLLPEYLRAAGGFEPRVHDGVAPEAAARFWLAVALAGTLPAASESASAARRAVEAFRALGDEPRLHQALSALIAIESRRGEAAAMQPFVDEARRLDGPGFRLQLRSQMSYAMKCWHEGLGRIEEAMACAREFIEQSRRWGSFNEQIGQAGLAFCEIGLGRLDQAEARVRGAFETMERIGRGANAGHVLAVHVSVLARQGRSHEAMAVGRRARSALERLGDEARLLEPLALAAADQGRFEDAACALGRVDADPRPAGDRRLQSRALRRDELDARLAQALGATAFNEHHRRGATLDLDQAFALAFAEANEGFQPDRSG